MRFGYEFYSDILRGYDNCLQGKAAMKGPPRYEYQRGGEGEICQSSIPYVREKSGELFAIKTFQAYQNDCEYFFLTTESHRFNDSDRPDTYNGKKIYQQ